jgi:hypothetical protein
LLKSIAKTQSETEQLVSKFCNCSCHSPNSLPSRLPSPCQKARYDKLEQEHTATVTQALQTLDEFKVKKQEFQAILDEYTEFRKVCCGFGSS